MGALSVMLAALVVLPPQAIGPASSIRSTADGPARHSESRSDTALQPLRFATGQGSAPGERPATHPPLARQEQQVMNAQELPLAKEEPPPAPATANIKPPPQAAPTEAVRPAPETSAVNVAKEPAQTPAPPKAASAQATRDRVSPILAKPAQKKPPSASARPAPAVRKSAPKDSQKAKELKDKELQEASSGMALPSPTTRKPPPKRDNQAEDGQDASGAMTYVEGREPRILGTITAPSAADGAAAPQGNPEARPAPQGPLSPATDFSITPEGVMAPSGVVMPFDHR